MALSSRAGNREHTWLVGFDRESFELTRISYLVGGLKIDLGAAPSFETAELAVAGFFEEGGALVEIARDFAGGMGVGREGDGDVGFAGEFEKLGGRVLLGAGFVEAGGVEFDRGVSGDDGLDGRIVKPTKVTFGRIGEFFDEVGVTENVEKAGAGHVGIFFPIGGPDFFDVCFGPAPQPFWIIEVPLVAEVVNGANKEIPFVSAGEIDDPFVAVGEPVALQPRPHWESGAGVLAGTLDPFEVFRELGFEHTPVVEGFGRLRGVVGNAVFHQSSGEGLIEVFLRFALCMTAKRGVGVVICKHWRFGVVATRESY